jgi:hypothetical protein
MKMGIGIGWPNASASNQSQMVYFEIEGVCGGGVPLNSTTQLVDNSIYQTGDYVDSGDVRVLLGSETAIEGYSLFNISGPVYTSCP